ncbi:hypothetical protein KC19_4G267500 [Ceratodon purpureus]|uniref:PPPDE domain-containing protein n=1 Tax=Ceratodon purpureus TaxID=3225 RepID=A0A8T0IF46_CERPU|nr:hypothetical protein KC19_4G267500 [Ceratodon purpureus]
MTEVILHVYDVTNSMNVRANSAILGLNRFMRGGIGIGGIFHGAVEVYNKEWSFGYCESGSGVFSCQPKRNPMYTYRESLSLGRTELTRMEVEDVVQELSREWPGVSYDLLSRNCNHFCDSLCVRLGVQRVPLWVNRFANAGDAAFEAVDNTMAKLRQAKEEMLSASRNAMQFMFGSPASSSAPRLDSATRNTPGNTNTTSPLVGSPTQLSFKSSSSSSHDSGSRDGSVISSSDSDDDDEQSPPPPRPDTLP